jgi:hypothetical protein
VRCLQVRQLWAARPSKRCTAIDVLEFYKWLEEHRPNLLKRGGGDAYQNLINDLSGLLSLDPERSGET